MKKIFVFLMIVVAMLLCAVPAMATPGTGLDIQQAIDRGLPLGFNILKLVDCEPYLGISNTLNIVNQWQEFYIYVEPKNVRLRRDDQGDYCYLNITMIAIDETGAFLYSGMEAYGIYYIKDDRIWFGLGRYAFSEYVEGKVILILSMYDGFRDRRITESIRVTVHKKQSFA